MPPLDHSAPVESDAYHSHSTSSQISSVVLSTTGDRSPHGNVLPCPSSLCPPVPVDTAEYFECRHRRCSSSAALSRARSDSSVFWSQISHSPIDREVGVKCISSGFYHTLLLTYSGEVYGWGDNVNGQVLYHGLEVIKSPIKIPLTNIISISAGFNHSHAISSEGKLYGWGWNRFNQINMSSSSILPITLIMIPYNFKEIFNGACFSLALTTEGQVIKWGYRKLYELIEDLNDIVFLYIDGSSFIAIDSIGNFFYYSGRRFTKIPVTQYLTPRTPFKGSVSLVRGGFRNKDEILVVDINGDVWQFINVSNKDSFNNKPIKVKGLTNIVSIMVFHGIYSAINKSGRVFVWGSLSRISELYEDCDEPICLEAFTNIEGISVGENFLFAYNKNTVWAWGRNYKGQLGTGDLIDRPQPVKVFGSEILGSFHHSKKPLDRMFSGLINLVYWELFEFLKNLFGNHPYVKARFYTKCSISKRVAKLAKEVFNAHPIQNTMLLKDPEDLNLNDDICDLQLQLTLEFTFPKVINTRIQKLDVYFDSVDYNLHLLSFFPNVEVIKLGGKSRSCKLNLVHFSNLKCLELACSFTIQQLPTSLVKLVLKNIYINVTDLSYLTSLKELVVCSDLRSDGVSYQMLEGQIPLPQSIVKLEVELQLQSSSTKIQLANLKELVIHVVPTNITEQNFPSLKFIQLIRFDRNSLSNSPLSPTKLISQGLIKSVKLIKNEYLVELSCFPWWIQYPANKYLIDIFRDFVEGFWL
ncbi:hypothetical protein P9112_013541 [Eukaryota sp. TZLM1-RC]